MNPVRNFKKLANKTKPFTINIQPPGISNGVKKENLWTKICANCPLCKYIRTHDKKGIIYNLYKILESFCPVCRMANLPGQRMDIRGEFETRYPGKPFRKKDPKIEEDLARRIQSILELVRRTSNRPSTIAYYEEVLTSSIRIEELKEAKEKGKKIIGTFCNFVPEELIYACNSIPVRLCAGAYETISPAEEVLPRDICPLIKSSLGFKLLGLSYFELCDLVILPTTCDGKKKLGEILNNFLPVWMLELPQRKNNQRARDFWFSEIKILKRRLEEFTGVKITREGLKQSIQRLHKRQAIFRKLYQLKRHNPPLINGRDSLLVVQSSLYDDIDRWTEMTDKLCEEVKQRTTNNELRTTRLLLTGAPIIWPNFKVLNIIEETGAVIVADELCSGTRALYDPVEVDEYTESAMLKAIANRYLLPSTCPCFTESNDRIDKILQIAKDFSVDGVIYHSLRLCQLYDIESHKVKQVLKDKGIPMLNIHTDYSQEDVEQIKTRVEAFLEMLKSRIKDWSVSELSREKFKKSKHFLGRLTVL